MKMKKFWKRFWTMNRHHAGGFTLVELIVVIAILAILGGVAVPAYSGYVKKANMQADMTLISEIEHALTLAYYNQSLSAGGHLILTADRGVQGVEADSDLEKALIATFGSGYRDILKLKYDEWGSSGLSDGLVGIMADAVNNSSFMKGNRVDALLSDVEKMTGMAQHLVTSLSSGAGLAGTTLSSLFTAEVLNATGAKYGIGEDSWTAADWDAWGAQEENRVAYGNLLVLAAADDIENNKVNMEFSPASNMIMEFSSYYAFAATNPAFSAVLDTKLNELQNVNDVGSGAAWYNALEQAAIEAGYDNYRFERDASGNFILDENGDKQLSQQYRKDYAAFGSLMAGLGNPTEEQADILAGDLGNAALFTNGVGNDMYNSYLDAVETISANFGAEDMEGITIPEGGVAIMYAPNQDGLVIFNSLPTN